MGAAPLLSTGELVADRYRVERPLGEGGMAAVYQARHTGTDKACALKLLLPHLARQERFREQFLNEARIAGKIGAHPNIVDVFDTGIAGPSGVPFIAMELLEGRTLAEFLKAEGPLAREVISAFVKQLASALEHAHHNGIVHRDLKPANIFVTTDFEGQLQLKVLDFGIAKILESAAGRTATQVGSPWYSAPEQLGGSMRRLAAERGITIAKGVSAATDVWAFGLIANELVAGLEAGSYWEVDTLADLMVRVTLEERRPPSAASGLAAQLPPGFDDWFLRCTRHNAAERWPSFGEAAAELRRLLDAVPPTAARPERRAATASLGSAAYPRGGEVLTETVSLTAAPPAAPLAAPPGPPAAPKPAGPPRPKPPRHTRTRRLASLQSLPRPALEATAPPPVLEPPPEATAPPPVLEPLPEAAPLVAAESAVPADTAKSWQKEPAGAPQPSAAVMVAVGAAVLLLAAGGFLLFRSGGELPAEQPITVPSTSREPAGQAPGSAAADTSAPPDRAEPAPADSGQPGEPPASAEPEAAAKKATTASAASASAKVAGPPMTKSPAPPATPIKTPPAAPNPPKPAPKPTKNVLDDF